MILCSEARVLWSKQKVFYGKGAFTFTDIYPRGCVITMSSLVLLPFLTLPFSIYITIEQSQERKRNLAEKYRCVWTLLKGAFTLNDISRRGCVITLSSLVLLLFLTIFSHWHHLDQSQVGLVSKVRFGKFRMTKPLRRLRKTFGPKVRRFPSRFLPFYGLLFVYLRFPWQFCAFKKQKKRISGAFYHFICATSIWLTANCMSISICM